MKKTYRSWSLPTLGDNQVETKPLNLRGQDPIGKPILVISLPMHSGLSRDSIRLRLKMEMAIPSTRPIHISNFQAGGILHLSMCLQIFKSTFHLQNQLQKSRSKILCIPQCLICQTFDLLTLTKSFTKIVAETKFGTHLLRFQRIRGIIQQGYLVIPIILQARGQFRILKMRLNSGVESELPG